MRIGAGLPSISAGLNTKRLAAATAAASNAGPADSATTASSTVPVAEIVICSTTAALRPDAFSASGYSASTNCNSAGGLVSCGAVVGSPPPAACACNAAGSAQSASSTASPALARAIM